MLSIQSNFASKSICSSAVRMQLVYSAAPHSALCLNGPSWIFFFFPEQLLVQTAIPNSDLLLQ